MVASSIALAASALTPTLALFFFLANICLFDLPVFSLPAGVLYIAIVRYTLIRSRESYSQLTTYVSARLISYAVALSGILISFAVIALLAHAELLSVGRECGSPPLMYR